MKELLLRMSETMVFWLVHTGLDLMSVYTEVGLPLFMTDVEAGAATNELKSDVTGTS